MATGRAQRIDEALRELIASGKKMTLKDVGDIQQDYVDVQARELAPKVSKIAQKMGPSLTDAQRNDL